MRRVPGVACRTGYPVHIAACNSFSLSIVDMSAWDKYIDEIIAQSKDASGRSHTDKACIFGFAGEKWTSDQHPCAFKLTPDERASIAKCFKLNNFSDFISGGVRAEGVTYYFLGESDGMITAKKEQFGKVFLKASNSAIVVAHTAEGMTEEVTHRAVTHLVDYLKQLHM